MSDHPLDNQIWHALTGAFARHAIGSGEVRRFRPEIAPAGGLQRVTPANLSALAALVPLQGTIMTHSAAPFDTPPELELIDRHQLLIMAADKLTPVQSAVAIAELSPADMPPMARLIEAAQPGPLLPGAFELGRFVGIRDGNELLAIAGDRLRVPGYHEVCTVCSHPAHRGRGYAKIVVSAIAEAMVARGDIPYLAVVPTNTPAVRLYESLGFTPNRSIYFNLMKRVA